MFNVVLVHPQIPPNTGNIGRLCVNTGAKLHLIEPLGFDINDKALKRAGLDYWHKLDPTIWPDLESFLQSVDMGRCFFATTKSQKPYFEAHFEPGDYLLFGSETKGLPEWLFKANLQNAITIPMTKEGRSLNLAVSVGIVLYEGIRQNYEVFKEMM